MDLLGFFEFVRSHYNLLVTDESDHANFVDNHGQLLNECCLLVSMLHLTTPDPFMMISSSRNEYVFSSLKVRKDVVSGLEIRILNEALVVYEVD